MEDDFCSADKTAEEVAEYFNGKAIDKIRSEFITNRQNHFEEGTLTQMCIRDRYKEYAGETKIALMDNSSLAFMHELSQRSYPSDGILSVYDLILIPKWVMEEIEDSTDRKSTRLNSSHSDRSRMPSSA